MLHTVILDSTVIATAAATVDAGVAADATTGSDNAIDGLDVNAAIGTFSSSVNGGTNGKCPRKWGSTQFLNFEEKTGNVNGLTAQAYAVYSLL
jgi:hypothetical protein